MSISFKPLIRSRKLWLAISLVFVVVGISLLVLQQSGLFVYDGPAGPVATYAAPQPVAPDVIQGNPVKIELPSLHLSLSVIPGTYDPRTRSWTLTNDKVQYAVMTPLPNNESGNTFMYGHYRWGVFATLHTIMPGAQAIVTTDNGHTFTYTFISSRITDPSDTSVFDPSAKPMLTIQTCTGLFFQNRQLFTFALEQVA